MESIIMKRTFEDITLEALVQYIGKTASPDVEQSVEKWLKADDRHTFYFHKIAEAWQDMHDLQSLSKNSIDNDWNIIARQIEKEKKKALKNDKDNDLWYKSTWTRIAALFIFLVAVGGGYFVFQLPKQIVAQTQSLYNEIVVPRGQKSQLLLSDGSKIWINAGSKLRFQNKFEGKSREVWLEGEAYFEVHKDPSHPFYVHTSDINIKVLGTVFNVKAYADEGIIETTLVSGLVSLEKKEASWKKNTEVFLKPNHKAIYLKNGSFLVAEDIKRHVSEPLEPRKIIISQPVIPEPDISWKDGKFVFEDEPFESIAKKLERRYDVSIQIEDEALKQYRYSGILKNISIEQAIKAIQLTAPIQYTIKENKIIITKRF
jgi:transmembrane sensor